MDEVEHEIMIKQIVNVERVVLKKRKRIVRLRFNIDANNLETGIVITHSCSPDTAEKIEHNGHRIQCTLDSCTRLTAS